MSADKVQSEQKSCDAIILLGRGGTNPAAQEQLEKRVEAVQLAMPQLIVGAFVDLDSPSLPSALQRCAEAGKARILVQPFYLPDDRNLHRWLAKVVMRWSSQWQGQAVEVSLADSLGEQPDLTATLIKILAETAHSAPVITSNPPDKWEHDPAGWSIIPEHSHHLFFCRGPRCTATGADRLAHHLREQLKEHKLLQGDRVLVAQSGCLYPCNHGPLMVSYPGGVWYGHLTEEAIDRIVAEHFVDGVVVNEYVIHSGK